MLSNEQIGIGVLILIIIYVYVRCSSVKVYRFYRPSCPACVSSQAEWDKFKKDTMFMMIRPIDINLDKPDNAIFAKNFAVTVVPTVIKVNVDGSSEVYNGERKAEAYMKWVKNK